MNTKAVIFDKDGTLLDFDSFWVEISYNAIREILEKIEIKNIDANEILEFMGVKNKETDITGVLCHGTYAQLAQEICVFLGKYGYEFSSDSLTELVVEAYRSNMHRGVVKPTCEDIVETLINLKNQGIRLIVVTTDDAVITKRCLEALKIEDLFDCIYTDDGKTPVKPDPYCIEEICRKYGLEKSQIVMVGDTLRDVEFARNGHIKVIGVAKNENNRKILEREADVVVPNISYVYDVID